MDIYSALKKDHALVRDLVNQLCEEGKDIQVYKQLCSQVRDELIPHSRAEEAVFYNSIRDLAAGKDLVAHSYGEHLQAESLLRALQAVEAFDAKGLGIARKLKDALEHHITEEEEKVMPAAHELFLDSEAEELGKAFEEMKPRIKEENILETTWDMVVNLMPKRLRGTFQKNKQPPTEASH